jgi:hypothetical protein
VSLQVDQDHLPALAEQGHRGVEHVERHEPAVQQQKRLPGAADLVGVIDALDGRALGFRFGRRGHG